MPFNHPWDGVPRTAIDDWKICPNCGAEFHRTHIRKKYCSANCRSKLTPQEKLIVERFVNLCLKYHLSKYRSFMMIAHEKSAGIFKEFEKPNYSNHHGGFSERKKTRILLAIKKFCDDFETGKYDMEKWTSQEQFNRDLYFVRRRLTPPKYECPRRVPTCRGGFLPYSCPTQFRECELA